MPPGAVPCPPSAAPAGPVVDVPGFAAKVPPLFIWASAVGPSGMPAAAHLS